MPSFSSTRIGTAALAATMLAFTAPHVAGAQQGIGVTVDGRPVNLSPSPIERAGRVFVPLRGVFERLGASVVYANGQINATKGERAISLQIGSTQATVDGHPQGLDVAPFIVGASTYVPLRFVAQALGDVVNWDNSNEVVAIVTRGGDRMDQGDQGMQRPQGPPPQGPPPQQQAAAPQISPIGVEAERPAPDSRVESNRPTIEARFQNGHADPNSVHVLLDQLDVTNNASRSPSGVVYSPPSDLLPQHHIVIVRGRDTDGRPFEFHWDFTSGSEPVHSYLNVTTPANDQRVGGTFTVRGRTLPNSRVTVEAGGTANVGGLLVLGTGSFRGDVTADADGNFTEDVSVPTVPGGTINLVVSATDPRTDAAAPQVRRRLIRG